MSTALLLPGAAPAQTACRATSPAVAVPVVELYTSEGCSSCPPADRWMSSLRPKDQVVALAFHVDYWDRLGWADRFARPSYTERQMQQQAVNGARFSYTPQIVVDGVDRKDWQSIKLNGSQRRPATVNIILSRDGPQFEARVQSLSGSPKRLAAYWAVTEDGHRSEVMAGENEGASLAHDHVVRQVQPVAAWTSHDGTTATLRFSPASTPDGRHPRAINLVVLDDSTGKPAQAIKLGC